MLRFQKQAGESTGNQARKTALKKAHKTVLKSAMALSAAASAMAAASAFAAPHMDDAAAAPISPPTEIAAPLHSDETTAATATTAQPAKGWFGEGAGLAVLAGALAGAFAGLVKILGWKRIYGAARKSAAATARVSAKAAKSAAKAAGEIAGKPLRLVSLTVLIGLFTLTGLWLFDLEWLGGMAAGAGISAFLFWGIGKTRHFFSRTSL